MPKFFQDNRKNPALETSFYVYDDLRAWQKGTDDTIFRYDTLEEAIQKFKELPNGLTTALGISFQDVHEIDLVQKNLGEPFLVSDYTRMDFIKNVPDFEEYLDTLKKELNLEYMSEYTLFGRLPGSVLIPIEEGSVDESYLKNKHLNPTHENPVSSIDEFYAEGFGWINYEAVKTASEINFLGKGENKKPKITKLAVNYIEKDSKTGRIKQTGTADISIAGYRHLLEKFQQFEKTDLASQVKKADEKAKEQSKSHVKQKGGKER